MIKLIHDQEPLKNGSVTLVHEGTGGSGGEAPPRRPEALARGVQGAGRPPVKRQIMIFQRNQSLGLRQLKWPRKISMASPNEVLFGAHLIKFWDIQ